MMLTIGQMLGIIGFLGHMNGLFKALMDKSLDGRNETEKYWIFSYAFFMRWNTHYTQKSQQRTKWIFGLINIPNDFWHHIQMLKIIYVGATIFVAISAGMIAGPNLIVAAIAALTWYGGHISGSTGWYECLLWKKPLDGIRNFIKKRSA